MRQPTNLMRREAEKLFPDSASEQHAFLAALLSSEPMRRPALLWTAPRAGLDSPLVVLPAAETPSWLPHWVTFLHESSPAAARNRLFEAGSAYPLDASSVFTASAMLAAPGAGRVLDVCAAPGGKSLFASLAFSPAFLLANEVVPKRLGILRHNLKKSGRPGLFTQRLDPAELALLAKACFDLVLVDAPCSGQSLLAKGIDNPGCFHPNVIKGNAKRQSHILRQSASCVAPGGYLFYSTCTFSRRENEAVVEKFLRLADDFAPVAVAHLEDFQSPMIDAPAFRFYPHRDSGAGGFSCLLQRVAEATAPPELPVALTDFPVA